MPQGGASGRRGGCQGCMTANMAYLKGPPGNSAPEGACVPPVPEKTTLEHPFVSSYLATPRPEIWLRLPGRFFRGSVRCCKWLFAPWLEPYGNSGSRDGPRANSETRVKIATSCCQLRCSFSGTARDLICARYAAVRRVASTPGVWRSLARIHSCGQIIRFSACVDAWHLRSTRCCS